MTQNTATAAPLYSTLGSDPDLAVIVAMFVDEAPERIAALDESYKNKDWDQLGCLAHQLKGAAGSYGFAPLTPLAARLEAAAREGDDEAAIARAYEEFVTQFRAIRSGTAGT